MKQFFTSESVSKGHPDKLADLVSDAVLDACLDQDPNSHVACECLATTGVVVVAGELKTEAYVDLQKVVRDAVKSIGYDRPETGFDGNTCAVVNMLHEQSPDIDQGVSGHGLKEYEGEQGAGDQGMMFGYACNETPQLMPAPIYYAHRLLERITELRTSGEAPWLYPDGKSQVTIEYEDGSPVRIDTVVISNQHAADKEHKEIYDYIVEKVIKHVLMPTGMLDQSCKIYINPTGRFVIGGPHGDSGLTGRKIIVDTYGGMGRHGGGAFSGKDPSKVDRSAAYAARYAAKNVVAAGLADRCEIQLSYAIGVPHPVSVLVETFGTEKVSVEKIQEAVLRHFDFSPAGIEKMLGLRARRGWKYAETTAFGHFGRPNFPWEATDKATSLKSLL